MLMNAKKTLTIATWTLLVETQMDPLCAPVYLDLTEMDGTAQVIASLWLWEMLVCVSLFVFILQESWLKACHFSDIDECARNLSCHVNANCTNTIGSHVCTCHTGYTGDGQTCSGDFNKFPSMLKKSFLIEERQSSSLLFLCIQSQLFKANDKMLNIFVDQLSL